MGTTPCCGTEHNLDLLSTGETSHGVVGDELGLQAKVSKVLLDLALLNVKCGVGKVVDGAHVIEMSVGDEDRRDIRRRDAAFGKHLRRAVKVGDPIELGQRFPVVHVIVAGVDQDRVPLALEQRVGIRKLANALVLRPIEHHAQRKFLDRGVLEHPNRIVAHQRSLPVRQCDCL